MARVKAVPRRMKKKPARFIAGRKVRLGVARRGKLNWHKSEKNYASVKESYILNVQAGNINYFMDALANLNFDRAQQIAPAYQQYRMKYIKLTLQPNYDTYINAGAPGSAAVIPQMYFMIDKSRSIPNGADFNTLLDLGCKPVRVDDRNIVRAWKPCVLVVAGDGPATAAASTLRQTPWLSTNGNAGDPGAFVIDETLHHGAVFGIEKSFGADQQQYDINVEVMFEFRRPNWKAAATPGEVPTVNITKGVTTPQLVAA